jgi:uncharacterized protein YbjQ (UPF0145 family)
MTEHEQPIVIVTTETVFGRRIMAVCGYVEAEASGGTEALEKLASAASKLGAQGVVGTRWAERGNPVYMIYGTAVELDQDLNSPEAPYAWTEGSGNA